MPGSLIGFLCVAIKLITKFRVGCVRLYIDPRPSQLDPLLKSFPFLLFLQVLIIMGRVAFFTLIERKILGYQQTRKGPNKPGPAGLLVPFADAIKLIFKEKQRPALRNRKMFILVPCFSLLIPITLWATYPSMLEPLVIKYSILLVVCVSSLGVFALLGAG